MEIDRTVGLADWPQTEVVGPADHHPIEPFHDRLRILPDFVTPGLVADRSTDALYSFLRGYRAEIDSAPPHRVTPPERESRPTESHREPLAEPDMNLSAHPAPIKQTLRSYRYPSVRRETFVPGQAVGGTGSPGPYGL